MKLESKKWNLVVLDLDDFTRRAFGAEYAYCRRVIVRSDMRVAKIFF